MGKKDVEALEITIDELPTYLHTNHSAYMEVADGLYYLTDVNDQYWRAQDTNQFNEKGHYVDCSPVSYTHLDVYKRQPRTGRPRSRAR